MNPKLIGNPLVAWRDEGTLQIGWGAHGLVVESAPAALPAWLMTINGDCAQEALVADAQKRGIGAEEARGLLRLLARAGLLAQQPALKVSIASPGLVHEPLATALTQAGVIVTHSADVVVFPQGQLPSMVCAPPARRLIPVWFSGSAVHVGPVIDDAQGPCPRCVDLAWADHDPRWSHLLAQAESLGLWGHSSQMVQAAAAISLMGTSQRTVGLEMILDVGNPGPCWRVWSAHPRCACQRT